MSLDNYKITQGDIETKGVVAAPDVLTGDPKENKKLFDRLIREAVAVQFNALIDKLKENGVENILQSGSDNVKYLRMNGEFLLEASADGIVWYTTGEEGKFSYDLSLKQDTINATGILKGDGDGKIVAAKDGVDYVSPNTAAKKSEEVTETLPAEGWGGSQAPYTLMLSVDGVTATSNQEILPALDITETELAAMQAANIQDGGQQNNAIVLKAFGEKPKMDLPIRVIKRGD